MRFAERPGSPAPGQRCPIVNRDAITAFGATGLSGVVPVLFMMAGGRLSIAACKRFVAPVKQPSRDHGRVSVKFYQRSAELSLNRALH